MSPSERASIDAEIGFNLVIAREDFCGAIVDKTVSSDRLEEIFDDFKNCLMVAFYDEEYSNNINKTGQRVADALAAQIGCISTLGKTSTSSDMVNRSGQARVSGSDNDRIKPEQIQKSLDLYMNNNHRFDIKRATIAALDSLVRPYLPKLELVVELDLR